MDSNLYKVEKNLRSIAKRYKSVKYSLGLAILFLMMGISAFSEEVVIQENTVATREEIATSKENLRNSVGSLQSKIAQARAENEKELSGLRLELIQLMEQGNQVVKSPWASWQFGVNYMYSKWNGTYKGRGDKAQKYPYEGVYTRSTDLFLRNVSPDSEQYEQYIAAVKDDALNSATTSTIKQRGGSTDYGLASTSVATEPLIGFEISAGINPRDINKSPITISDKIGITPALPEAISFTPPKPIIKLPVLPSLPVPPSFNIKLGSFCNGMGGNGCRAYGTDGGQYGYGTTKAIGTPRTFLVGGIFIGYVNTVTLNTNDPSLTHGWASSGTEKDSGSALFYAYFDAMDGNKGPNSSVILNGNLTVTSINPVQSDTSLSSYNRQKFLVGGSRIGTLDNVRDGTLKSNATINLVGPLTVGFEVQSDLRFKDDAKIRTLENAGIITDKAEENNTELDGILAKGAAPIELELAQDLGGPNKIKVSRTLEGYTGYKVGLIMTYEQKDINPNSKYVLKNSNIINFSGEKSIGIQIFAPKSPSRVEVLNASNSTITLGGIESYGMKWSSRVANNSTMDNRGTLKISGDAGTELLPDGTTKVLNSLSSGIAVIEGSSSESGNSAIRAYQGKVKNSRIIDISGGKGNTGIVLLVNAADDITNAEDGTINVNSKAGRQNIAMRVEKGSVVTDNPGTPKAINNGNIYLEGDSSIGMIGINANVENKLNKKIVTKANSTIINGIGMATHGGKLENAGEIDLQGTGDSTNIGIYMAKGTSSPTGMLASTSKVKVKGNDSTGVLVSDGTLNYGGNITAEGNGISGLIIGDNASGITNSTITNNGTITVNNGTSGAAGIYEYMNGTNKIKKGSYGIIVGKNSKFISDGTHNVDVNINVKGAESIGLYAGENAKLEVKNHTVNADSGAVNYDADKNSILTLKGTGAAYTGKKSLLFYLGENGTGKISIGNTMNAIVEGGTTPAERGNAFYYVGNGSAFSTTEIENWAKTNFGDGTTSTLNNLNLTMKPGSRLFIAQNTGMNLSDTTGNTISSVTGANITGNDYKTFMLYLSKLTINQDVNLDDTADAYNQLEIANSSITNANNKTIAGIQANHVAMAQENDKTLYSRNKVTLANEGEINLGGINSTGIYAKYGELHNKVTGIMTITDKSTAMYGIDDSLLENAGKITIGTNSIAMYSEGSITQAMKNIGTINLPQTDSVAMSYKPDSTLATGTVLENTGNIELKGDRNTAIYAAGTPAYKVKNSGTVTLANSAILNNPNVGIYTTNNNVIVENTGILNIGKNTIGIYGYAAENSGKLNVGNTGIGIYSQNEDVNLTDGKITTGTDKAVGVYTVGNGQNITNSGTIFEMEDNSFGFVNVGSGNTLTSSTANVNLGNDSVYIYSTDSKGSVTNSTSLMATGSRNYGIYSAGTINNSGNMNFGSGIGNVGIYLTSGTASNTGILNIGGSDLNAKDANGNSKPLYGIGMATTGGEITNDVGGTINVTGENSIGMYTTGSGHKAINKGTINLSASNTTGIYADDGAEAINSGTIKTSGTGLSRIFGVYLGKNSTLTNTGTISIDATNGAGVYLKGGVVNNTGTITVTVNGKTAEKDRIKEFTAPPTGKKVGGVEIVAPSGATSATITVNGNPVTPEVIKTSQENFKSISSSSIGMYINTSSIDYTKPIDGLGYLTKEADLIIGVEASKNTNSKYILINDPNILNPYNQSIRNNPQVGKWNIYSGSLTWAATTTLNKNDGTMTNIYMAKIPYTNWAGNKATPVDKKDTYNFTDGLEQRYGVEELGSRENQVFQKLTSIGNNEEVLLYQAYDEMMGHQYANVQQRVQATGIILDKEFDYLRNEWQTVSKDSNKIKTFGTKGEYKTDTAGVIDYKYNAYGVAYVHENEDIKLGRGIGWYTGIVHNTIKFKDIGNSKEKQLQAKVGIFKSVPFDDNNSLNWTISGDIFAGYNKMHRKFLVVDEIFNAKAKYYTYGIGIKNEIGKEFRLSETFTLRPYVALGLEYGRVSKIREKSGEVKLEVKQNDYVSVKPEVGAELAFKHYFGRKTLRTGLSVAYENELGRVAKGKNKAKVKDTSADWFNIRGEKEDRKGNVKFDLNIGLDNQRYGVTANVGYDTKGENLRGGLGLRVIF